MVSTVILSGQAKISGQKYIRAKDGPFMTKALRKENMHRTRLRNKYNNDSTEENFKAFKKQRNKCVKLLRRIKFDYYV